MKPSVATLALLLAVSCVAESKWDDLKVTWGTDPAKFFKSQPRTLEEAKAQGFKLVDNPGYGCSHNNKQYLGFAYTKNDDYALTLLFDKNGFIAGVQFGVTDEQIRNTGYPDLSVLPFWSAWGRQAFTAYFVEPSTICTKGRTQQEFDEQGTGTGLWFQNTGYPLDVTKIAAKESDLTTPWVEGKCFNTIGKHYWNGITRDMKCKDLWPAFLTYNSGELSGYGWGLFNELPSPHFEHPSSKLFQEFMKVVPWCFAEVKKISTMHIFFTSNPEKNTC